MAGTLFIRRSGAWVPLTTTGNSGIWSIGVAEPTLNNTGPAGIYSANPSALSALTPIQGDVIVTTPNTTLINKDIFGFVKIRAANVSLLGCRVRGFSPSSPSGSSPATTSTGLVDTTNSAAIGALVQDSYLVPDQPSQYVDGVFPWNYTAIRNTVLNCVDGFGSFNPSTSANANTAGYGNFVDKHAWFYPAAGHTDGSHCDGLQHQGGNKADWRGNRFTGLVDNLMPGFSSVNYFAQRGNHGGLYLANSALQVNINTGSITSGFRYSNNWVGGGDLETLNIVGGAVTFDDLINNVVDGNNGLGTAWSIAMHVSTTVKQGTGNVFRNGSPVIFRIQSG